MAHSLLISSDVMRPTGICALVLLLATAALSPALGAPGAFTLAGSSGACNGTSPAIISLTWTASAGATSYVVYRNNAPITGALPASTTAYQDQSIVFGTFNYFIRASDGATTTDSNTVVVTAPNCTPAPGAFTLSASEFCYSGSQPRHPGVHLTWTASTNATSYDVYRDNVTVAQGLSSAQRSVDDISPDLTTGVSHTYYIVANNAGSSTNSNSVQVTITSNACPPLPTNPTLSGSAACNTSTNPAHAVVNLTWTASTNATAYQIFRNGSAYAAATSTAYTDDNVSVGQSYSYMVRATNNSGSADSNTINVDVPTNICGTAPGAFTLTGGVACVNGAGGVHLSWTASSAATGYNIFRNNVQLAGPTTATSYDDNSGLTVGSSYSYRVAAVNASGTTQSNTISVDVSGPNCGPPGASIVSSVTPFCTSGASPAPALRVSWPAVPNASSYVVNRNGSPISGTLSAATTSYDDTSVAPGQTYYYTVTATNAGGSTQSAGASGTAPTSCAQQTPLPGGFSASASAFCTNATPSGPGVHVTWTASTNAASYVVNRDGSPITGAFASSTLSFDDTTVAGGQSYSYSVTATNTTGSTTSTSANVTTSASCAPPKPAAPALSSSIACAGSPSAPVIRLTWTAASGASNYTVYRNGSPYTGLQPSSTTSVDDANVTAGENYSYFVRASNASGSTDSNLVTVAIPVGTCQRPPGDFALSAATFCDRTGASPAAAVRLSWTASSGVASYGIQRNGVVIGSVAANTLTYNDANVTTGTPYSYVVRANGAGGTTSSNTVSITPSSDVCASAGAPDLVPSDIVAAPVNVLPGEHVALTFTVTNNGDATASASTTRVRFGATLETATIAAALATPSLNARASTMLTTTITVPAVSPGTYYLFITVDDDHIVNQLTTANDTLRSDAITVRANSCSTECGATVVGAATVGASVGFALTNAPSCPGANVQWSFGDSTTASGDATSHAYGAPGMYNWSVTVAANGASCRSSGTITIVATPSRRRAVTH